MAFTFIRLDWPNVIRLLSYDSAPAFRVCWCWHGDYTNREPRQLNLTMWMNFSNSRYIPFTEEVLFSSSYLPEFLKLFNGVCTLHAFFFALPFNFFSSIYRIDFLFLIFCFLSERSSRWLVTDERQVAMGLSTMTSSPAPPRIVHRTFTDLIPAPQTLRVPCMPAAQPFNAPNAAWKATRLHKPIRKVSLISDLHY